MKNGMLNIAGTAGSYAKTYGLGKRAPKSAKGVAKSPKNRPKAYKRKYYRKRDKYGRFKKK